MFRVENGWLDVELGSVPCAFSTAENMIHHAKIRAGETVLVTGAWYLCEWLRRTSSSRGGRQG